MSALFQTRRKFAIRADATDRRPPFAGPVQLRAAESEARLFVNVTEPVRQSYLAAWQAFVGGLEKTCLSRGAIYVQAATEQPFERLVLATLARAGVLQD